MPRVTDPYSLPADLVLGTRITARVPESDQHRQRREAAIILDRLRTQPGIVLADEVGMGKTFVALAVAYSVAVQSPRGPAIVMVPANLVEKWEQDLKAFCDLYVESRRPVNRNAAPLAELRAPNALRYAIARHSVDFLKLLDDAPRDRCHVILLAQGAMGRRQTDRWIRLALIAEALRRHARGGAKRLISVKKQIHRYLAQLLYAVGQERAADLGAELWQELLRNDTAMWMTVYNESMRRTEDHLTDDPVPKAVARALKHVDLKPLATALEGMPVHAVGGQARISQRLDIVRRELRKVEDSLWAPLLAEARWHSPLLIMDEAHHLKNPGTLLARQLQSKEGASAVRVGDGAMAQAFDRMLFLTATPFQLGHRELVHVLQRFGDIQWRDRNLGDRTQFVERLNTLQRCLDESQRTAIAFQQRWQLLRTDDLTDDPATWVQGRTPQQRDALPARARAAYDALQAALKAREDAETALRPWVVRHNKPARWSGTTITRRDRIDGGRVAGLESDAGLPVPANQLFPFFLAARSATAIGKDLLGEALSSSYEAFRRTRESNGAERDDEESVDTSSTDLSHSRWFLDRFDEAIDRTRGATHPKVGATVRKAVDLWEKGEKVLVFAFYRHTCRALRIHISQEIERRLIDTARRRLGPSGASRSSKDIDDIIETVQRRFFDDADGPGRRAVDSQLARLIETANAAATRPLDAQSGQAVQEVMRRFLRVRTTLVRCFPLGDLAALSHEAAVERMIDEPDASGISWKTKFETFLAFLVGPCTEVERRSFIDAALRTQTGSIRVEAGSPDDDDEGTHRLTLANVQGATGATKRESRTRLMRAFNTPFFPDILVCSEVMGEGVDLQRYCRHVIHHDLAWNPSTIEQRTGRVDRIGCKAEGSQPIAVYMPYLAGASDERQYRVMVDREKWFRVVMGQEEVARLIPTDAEPAVPLPESLAESLNFELGIEPG